MTLRIKYEKYDKMRFLGHLDLMRYFQKALRRANFPLEFTKGFHPHPIMNFALPLSVGVSSEGEYFDVKLSQDVDVNKAKKAINDELSKGIKVIDITIPENDKKKLMSMVISAVYYVYPRNGILDIDRDDIESFLSKKSIILNKQTKNGEKTDEIRDFIYEMDMISIEKDNKYIPCESCVRMHLKCGSEYNLPPIPVLKLLYENKGLQFDAEMFSVHRHCLILK